LERLLGSAPEKPIDASQLQAVETQTQAIAAARREKVAAAGGELVGAALSLVAELIDEGPPPKEELVGSLRQGLLECVQRDQAGRPHLRISLPDDAALGKLAESLARLLIAHDNT